MNVVTILNLASMEIFKPAALKGRAYRSAIIQKDSIEMDRYIYGMKSEGIANSRGSFTKRAIPLSGTGIKGTSKANKTIAIVTGKEIPAKGIKRGAKELTKRNTDTPTNIDHSPKIKRAKKWRGL